MMMRTPPQKPNGLMMQSFQPVRTAVKASLIVWVCISGALVAYAVAAIGGAL
jgi:hypothetical protein